MLGEVTLKDVLDRFEGGIKDRTEGLANLKYILRNNNKLGSLNDGSFHQIYESVFRLAVSEQSAYLKANSRTIRTATENRLSGCASALRIAVESGIRVIRLKTVRSVLDHIIQTLRLSDGSFCEPVALDYAKCLKVLFTYQPHVEHLPEHERERVVVFCIECIKRVESEFAEDDTATGAEVIATAGASHGLSYLSSRSHHKDSGGSQGDRSLAKQIAEEMVGCLSLLTSAPNASSGDKSDELLATLIGFLRNSQTAGRSHQDAFCAINNILAWTRTEKTELTRKTTPLLIRLIHNFWTAKSSFKDEMLITMIYVRPYILAMMQDDEGLILQSELSALLDAIRIEYVNRGNQDRYLLHTEELRMNFEAAGSKRRGAICTSVFRLRCTKAKTEANWATVYFLASLCNMLTDQAEDDVSSAEEDDQITRRPRKRQRLTNEFEDTLTSSVTGGTSTRICSLQILAFLAQQRRFDPRQLSKAIDKITTSCTDENATVSSWALLSLASFASQALSADISLASRWSSVWQLSIRLMSSLATCRAACHLLGIILKLRIVPHQNIADLVQMMASSMGVSGPPLLVDSTSRLLIHVLQISQQMNPTSASAAAEGILNWTLRNFLPSKFEDRVYASQNGLFEPSDVVDLIACCVGQLPIHPKSLPFPLWDSIGQAWLRCENQQDLIEYLLLLSEQTPAIASDLGTSPSIESSASLSRASCEKLLVSHLISEIYLADQSWAQLVRERPGALSLDTVITMYQSCVIATCLAFCGSLRDSRLKQLQNQIRSLLEKIASFIASQHCSQDKFDAILTTFSYACHGLHTMESHAIYGGCETVLSHCLSRAMGARRSNRAVYGIDEEDDAMELDEAYDSQESRRGNETMGLSDLKNDWAVKYNSLTLRSSLTTYTTIISARSMESNSIEQHENSVSAQIVDYIVSLPESSMLLSHDVISSLSRLGVELSVTDAERLLEYCSVKILDPYAYNRSEVALGAVLNIMSGLASSWTDSSSQSLFTLGIDMYEWYTGIALSGGVLSPLVQNRVASLLLQLCHISTDYGRDHDVPSVRTSLLKLLKLGNITVKFHLANRISTIFGLFVLSEHLAMFDDLQTSLPDDVDWVEGIAMRLLILAKLASAWHSLLRECVYYIFEAAGTVKGLTSTRHATWSVVELAKSLNFNKPQKLFQLFAPQLLNTWLEKHKISTLPFSIFQYESLEALFAQNCGEIVAQLLVRDSQEELYIIATALKTTPKDLIVTSFAKCLAYSISYDITKSGTETKEAIIEFRLRSSIGGDRDEYAQLVMGHFAATMGHFYLSSQQDRSLDDWLERRPKYAVAARALSETKNFSHSDRPLPPDQEPTFKSKSLFDRIERLCRRTKHDAVKPWDASSFALAARMLLDSVEDALGPLHTSVVIRRLRLLICMGGDVATNGFPLEMLLHTLRPFLNSSECADDTIGVLQYLFHHGQAHLQTNHKFLYGTVTLIILQMRKHSGAILESTTQEIQHKSTVQRMLKFQSWLVHYLQTFQPSETLAQTCSNFTKALANVNLPGNARRETPESSLLLLLLDQEDANDTVMQETHSDEALALLSENFEAPKSLSDDCLEHDLDCAKFASRLWRALEIPNLGETFIAWALSILGRAYASTGKSPSGILGLESDQARGSFTQSSGVARSQAIIADKLSRSLLSRSRAEASLSDYTLRSIMSSFQDAEEAISFERMLPNPVVSVVENGNQGYEPFIGSLGMIDKFNRQSLRSVLEPSLDTTLESWAQCLSLILCQKAAKEAILPALSALLQNNGKFAQSILPCIIHILLAQEQERDLILRTELSSSVAAHFADTNELLRPKQRYLINLVLYLRAQPLPGENTKADRLRWLDIDWLRASEAAVRCGMSTSALLFAESASSSTHGNRRGSSRTSLSQVSIEQLPQELLLSIFDSMEEPDSFYGVEQSASLDTVLDRLDYERNGFKSLMFRSAQSDAHLRRAHQLGQIDATGMIRSLSVLNLNSLSLALLSGTLATTTDSPDELLNSARRLQQWDILAPASASKTTSNCFTAFQAVSRADSRAVALSALQSIVLAHGKIVTDLEDVTKPTQEWFTVLASLIEINDIVASSNEVGMSLIWDKMRSRQSWMHMAPYENFSLILSSRQTLFSVLAQNKPLLSATSTKLKDCLIIETDSLLEGSRFAREHGQLQEALTAATQANELMRESKEIGLRVDAAAKFETASVLWSSGETTSSVKMLQDVLALSDLNNQDLHIGRSGLLAQLSHQLAEARLEKPDEILANHLKPAISQLNDCQEGQEAGKVFFEFATFCDKQLQNPDNIEDLNRITKLRQRKLEEVEELQRLSGASKRSVDDRDEYARDIKKAKSWFDIDNTDYQRLKQSRDTFMQQSLQNYMLALHASDDYDISVLRFFALWLENADVAAANKIVKDNMPKVASWKFVVLMNQLVSRLEQEKSPFQTTLRDLAVRICTDHPHHSLHHLYALTRKPSSSEPTAISRYDVATNIRKQLTNDQRTSQLLVNVFKANGLYNILTVWVPEASSSNKVPANQVSAAAKVMKGVPDLKVPPATINLALRPDGNYKDIPTVVRFSNTLQLMSGVSKPKKMTAYGSDGRQYMQLFKSGQDDLRQDAIMEQVFGEVSKMLRNHKTTRQRHLQVRTYKVIPLSPKSGIIEFVPNSTSFSEFLVSAHERYHPQDMKNNTARSKIRAAENLSTESRIKEYRKVCEHMHPVLRHFFFERYNDPDDWFQKRTAYTRTTAAISILGYVLGLGDRHCQNIMLDEKTGEVVHIDLGIAFEAGRVLPVPELVPFRLTRDVIDGMGITKTEGVFRRCCEFTLDALREDTDSIMTLLNVLRYDPLYTWTVSPLRAKQMQEETGRNAANGVEVEGSSKKKEQEAGEADRALSIVEKKLSKTLSTAATVNELIQQATDERNLATLFQGWSAYF